MKKYNLKSGFLFVALGVAIFVFSMDILTASATVFGVNGKIAFTSQRDGNTEIYVINADGTGETRLTTDPASDGDPAWSPDGSKIAFWSTRGNGLDEDIYVMNADGSGVTRLTTTSTTDREPAWSPDGSKIAFSRAPLGSVAYEIYVMNADGTNQINLTNNPAADLSPTWSPDGTKIAFTSFRNGSGQIYVMNANGSNPIQLTSVGLNNLPDWSPDGLKIAFVSRRDGNDEIYVMSADGSNQTNITHNSGDDEYPSWSSDDSGIVFSSNRDVIPAALYIYHFNDGTVGHLTNEGFATPDWQSSTGPVVPPLPTHGITVTVKNSANIRSDRGTSASIIGVAQRGSFFELLPLCSEMDSMNCNDGTLLYILKDGHYWLKVKWNGIQGYVADDLVMTVVPNNQPARVKGIMEATFSQPDFTTIQSFPIELLLAIVAHESGGTLNNEVVSVDSPFSGIMQVHPSTSGWNGNCISNKCKKIEDYWTNIKNPFTDLFGISTDQYAGQVFNGKNYIGTQYSNTDQGLGDNISDGLKVLNDKYSNAKRCPNLKIISVKEPSTGITYQLDCGDIEKLLTAWAYNGFAKDSNGNYTGTYLRDIADSLQDLSNTFPSVSYPNTDNLVEKLHLANNNKIEIKKYSPVDLRIQNSSGETVGQLNGGIQDEIYNATYDPATESIAILFPQDTYTYIVTGTSDGTYGLSINSSIGTSTTDFLATDVPVTTGAVHEYTVDEAALAQGKNGVAVKVDENGDGVFDYQFTTSATLNDQTPPTTQISLAGTFGANGWYTSDVSVTLAATDNTGGAGVRQTEYSLDNGTTWNTYTNPFTITAEGINTLLYRSQDFIGNIEQNKFQEIKIDKIQPKLQLVASPNVLWPANHKMVNVTMGGSAFDSLSGIDSVSFVVADEYGKVQPAVSSFGDSIQLEAWRNGDDLNGRLYTIYATATDKAGTKTTIFVTVVCPHDQRK